MKRILLFLFVLISASSFVFAEDKEIPPPPIIKKGDGSNQGFRAPAILPVEIVYNTETAALRISS